MTTSDVLKRDFSGPLAALGELSDRVATALDRQRQIGADAATQWAIVPTLLDLECRWLLIADDAEGERRGLEVFGAFFGPAVARTLPGPANVLATSPPVSGIANVRVLELQSELPPFVEALELMTSVRGSAPVLRRDLPDPIGFLLRDFYLALDQQDPRASEHLLSRIEATGHVGSENLRFLRVERLARLGHWHELGSLPWFGELARARRPVRISEHLIEAVWRLEFDEGALAADPRAASVRYEAGSIDERFGALLRSVDVPTTPSGRRIAALFAHLAGDAERVERILGRAGSDEHGLLNLLTERVVAPIDAQPLAESALEQARECFEQGDYSGVVRVAEADRDLPLVTMAVRAAFELNDPRLAARATALLRDVDLASLPDSPGFSRMLTAIRRLAENLCGTWTDWLERVAADERWPDAAEVARDLSATWPGSDLRTASGADHAAELLLLASEGVNAREVRGCLDLVCHLARELSAAPACDRFVDATLLVLSSDENPSTLVRAAFFELLMGIVASGPSRERYNDVIATADALWTRVRSRDSVGWILDVLDGLSASSSPDEGCRRALVATVANSVRDIAARMPLDERTLLEAVAAECGVGVTLPPPDVEVVSAVEDQWKPLRGKLVGLYSLLPGAGSRLADRLRYLADDVRVEQNSDTVATSALRSLAANADYLIVDTRHASHAATAAVDDERPRDLQLFPAGGGLSSFLARLREALEQP